MAPSYLADFAETELLWFVIGLTPDVPEPAVVDVVPVGGGTVVVGNPAAFGAAPAP